MVEQRHAEFRILEEKAHHALEYVATPKSAPPFWVLQFCAYPAFGDAHSYTIFAEKDYARPLLRHTHWKRVYDRQRFLDPMMGLREGWHTEPTLAVSEVALAEPSFAALMQKRQQIQIPSNDIETYGITIDGWRFSLQMSNFKAGFRLNWWGDGPPEWQELTGWARELEVFLSQAVGE
ncbi:MAG TPA: hypothetical protein VHO69_04480 [Phototrophicaceae bacterium]|nr:hypothetical protein [Phototrophicaceae bacterium]